MDWPKVLSDLREDGWTQQQIADHCGVSQATVSDLNRGITKSPAFDLGTRLLELRDQAAGQKAAA